MIALSWRQFRTQAAVAIVGLVAVAIVLTITGNHLVHLYDTTVANCAARGDCQTAMAQFTARDPFLRTGLTALLFVVPGLIGIFWGAPLVARELETGTFRLAWTQSVTRERWLAVKLAVVGLAGILAAGVLSLMVTRWFAPLDRVNANQFSSIAYDARNLVPIGYAAFAFALGVTGGLLIRRTLPAMATTLAGFVGARLAFTHWIRPNLISAAHTAVPLSSATNLGFEANASGTNVMFVAGSPHIPNAWAVSSRIVDAASKTVGAQSLTRFLNRACPGIGAPPKSLPPGAVATVRPASQSTFDGCVAQLSDRFHLAVSYQPASRLWTFQWLEMGCYLVLALILAAICLVAIRRRLA